MQRVFNLYRSSVGKKVMMAATGVVFLQFVIVHMFGNLKAFQGAEKFDRYAEFLREMGAPIFGRGQVLWIFRIGLLLAVTVHIIAAVQLWRMSKRARPIKYSHRLDAGASTYASRTMRWGGIIIVLFVVYHLLHLTVGTVHPDFVPGSPYHNLVAGFQWWPVPIAYIVAMCALATHIYHGVWSGFQTIGANHPRYNSLRRPFAALVAMTTFLGFVSIPVSVLAGILK